MATTSQVEVVTARDAEAYSRGRQRAIQPFDTSPDDAQDVMEASRLADLEVPDGGYGWVIVFSGAVLAWWFVGASYTWGVMQAALVVEKGYAPSTLAFVGSLSPACISVFAVPNARLIRLIGARLTGMIGVALLALGSMLGGFAVGNIGALFVTWGVVGGIGTSLCFMVISTVPAQYFRVKRGLANGIVYAGGGMGGVAISFSLNALLRNVGLEWTFRALGFMIFATGLPAAYLMQERSSIQRNKVVDWALLKDIRFLLVFITGLIGTFPLFVPVFFLPLYAGSIGLSSSTGAALVAVFNLCSTFGRLLCGFACDKLGPLNTLFFTQLLSGLSLLAIWPASTSIAPLVLFVIVNGAANGGFFAIMPTVVSNVFGSARVSVAMGMIVTGWLGGYLLGAPIAGYMLDAFGGESAGVMAYRPAIFYAGSMAALAAVLAATVRLKVDRSLKKTI